MTFDVTSLGGRRAASRWSCVAMGDMLERLVWSIPDKETEAIACHRFWPDVTAAAIIAFAREGLAGFETPQRVVFVDRYPETVGGKVRKHILRAELGGKTP